MAADCDAVWELSRRLSASRIMKCRCIEKVHPAQAGPAELVAASFNGHLQRRVKTDVALLASYASR